MKRLALWMLLVASACGGSGDDDDDDDDGRRACTEPQPGCTSDDCWRDCEYDNLYYDCVDGYWTPVDVICDPPPPDAGDDAARGALGSDATLPDASLPDATPPDADV